MPTKHEMVHEIHGHLPRLGRMAPISEKALSQLFGNRYDRRLYSVYREAAAGRLLNATSRLVAVLPQSPPAHLRRPCERIRQVYQQLRHDMHVAAPVQRRTRSSLDISSFWACPGCGCRVPSQPTHCPNCDEPCS